MSPPEKLDGMVISDTSIKQPVFITMIMLLVLVTGALAYSSLPVNLLIVPVQSYIMVLGGLGVLAAMVFWPLGQVLVWGSWLFLTFTWIVVRFFANFPFASADVGSISFPACK